VAALPLIVEMEELKLERVPDLVACMQIIAARRRKTRSGSISSPRNVET
jgi:hypothetical protein